MRLDTEATGLAVGHHLGEPALTPFKGQFNQAVFSNLPRDLRAKVLVRLKLMLKWGKGCMGGIEEKKIIFPVPF